MGVFKNNLPAFIFDMDDTLYERHVPFMQACNKIFGGKIDVDSRLLFQKFTRRGNEVFEASMNGTISMEEMWIYRIRHALKDIQIEISPQEALEFQRLYDWYQHHIELSGVMTELFGWCKEKGITLGIITNGTSEHQRMKFHALGLGRWIPEERLLVTGDIGINKPDPAVFQEAVRRMRLDLRETWYVGDTYEHDIAGAKAAGWNTVWLDRGKREEGLPGDAADETVHTEEELQACIRTIYYIYYNANKS